MDQHTKEQWSERLRAAGLRVTGGRVAVLGHLQLHPHSSAADVFTALAPSRPSLSVQSAHNIVHDLTVHGLLRRVEMPDSSGARYEVHHNDNHHHVQCVVCERIEDVPCTVGAAPCLTPGGTSGMRILEASVIFWGVCSGCETELSEGQRQTRSNSPQTNLTKGTGIV